MPALLASAFDIVEPFFHGFGGSLASVDPWRLAIVHVTHENP